MKKIEIDFDIPVVILCGGKGIRLKEKTMSIPKPLIQVGKMPLLWHVMKIYASQGFKNFILCLGYKGYIIKKYFSELLTTTAYKGWKIKCLNTGINTPTGGRIKLAEQYINSSRFMATYADGLSDINICSLLAFHLRHKHVGTLTAVHPYSYFGELKIDRNSRVVKFDEKPLLNNWINGGFFVFESSFLKLLSLNDVLEQVPLSRLARKRQLLAYKHKGFWKCLDTYKDLNELNQTWQGGNPLWKVW